MTASLTKPSGPIVAAPRCSAAAREPTAGAAREGSELDAKDEGALQGVGKFPLRISSVSRPTVDGKYV